jgi:ribulose-5-phosphate 4-epimerase/fuculose-1-phosphate aldolase
MKVIDDGVIKYDRSNFSRCETLSKAEYQDLEYWREKLYKLNLIGEYPEAQVGFGNMSMIMDYQSIHNTDARQFVITGTQTGKYSLLNGAHYTRVLDYEIEKLKIKMMGAIEASSEALTHAAIYAANNNIKVIFHIHSTKLWEGMIKDRADFTEKEIPYGTVEMAKATQKCIEGKNSGIFCMHGHEDGIVVYGRNLEEVGALTIELNQKYISSNS